MKYALRLAIIFFKQCIFHVVKYLKCINSFRFMCLCIKPTQFFNKVIFLKKMNCFIKLWQMMNDFFFCFMIEYLTK